MTQDELEVIVQDLKTEVEMLNKLIHRQDQDLGEIVANYNDAFQIITASFKSLSDSVLKIAVATGVLVPMPPKMPTLTLVPDIEMEEEE